MKWMVGYNGGAASNRALTLACQEAKKSGAMLFVVNCPFFHLVTDSRREDLQKSYQVDLRFPSLRRL